MATPENEAELAAFAKGVPASELASEIAAWMNRNLPPEDIAGYQRRQRMVKWRHSPDGMIVFSLRLEPHIGAVLNSLLTALVMRSKASQEPDGTPVADTVMVDLVDGAHLRVMIHDPERRPINLVGPAPASYRPSEAGGQRT